MRQDRQTSAAKRVAREEAANASADHVHLPASHEWRLDPTTNYSLPVLNTDEAADVLQRWRDGKTREREGVLIEGIAAFPPDGLGDLYAEAMFAVIRQLAGEDFFERTLAEANQPPPPSQAEIAAKTAQDVVQSVASVAYVLSGQRAFQKASGAPKPSALCRELIKRGFTPEQLMQAGYNRTTVSDAKKFEQARLIKLGQPLPDHLAIKPGGARRTGDALRTGTGQVVDENREASRIVATVAPLLVKPSRKSMHRNVRGEINGIAAQSLIGSYDVGETNFDDDGDKSV